MASIEFIQKRLDGKEKELAKLTKKLERINKAKDSGWEVNPYYYSESDLKWTLRDIENVEESLRKYREDLAVAIEKSNSRNVPAILEFLEMWKARLTEFYGNGLKEYYDEKEKVHRLYEESAVFSWGSDEYKSAYEKFDEAHKAFSKKCHGYYEDFEEERFGRKYKGQRKVMDGEYEYLSPYSRENTYDGAMAYLKKDLDEEANRKYDFIIERTNQLVGKITDASQLEVGAKGDLNGFILGEKGTAKVNTIGAGGYNIQCFHFRTLINKVN